MAMPMGPKDASVSSPAASEVVANPSSATSEVAPPVTILLTSWPKACPIDCTPFTNCLALLRPKVTTAPPRTVPMMPARSLAAQEFFSNQVMTLTRPRSATLMPLVSSSPKEMPRFSRCALAMSIWPGSVLPKAAAAPWVRSVTVRRMVAMADWSRCSFSSASARLWWAARSSVAACEALICPSATPSSVFFRAIWAVVTPSVAVRMAESFPEPMSRLRPSWVRARVLPA